MNIPFYRQSHDHTCGPAVIHMIFAYFGVHENSEKIETLLECSEASGVSHKKMIETVRHYGFICHERRGSSIAEIRRFLSKNIPVIINYTEHLHDEGHYAVAVDVTDKNIVLNDPWHGKNFSMHISEFEKRWKNSTGRSKKWLVGVSQKTT